MLKELLKEFFGNKEFVSPIIYSERNSTHTHNIVVSYRYAFYVVMNTYVCTLCAKLSASVVLHNFLLCMYIGVSLNDVFA